MNPYRENLDLPVGDSLIPIYHWSRKPGNYVVFDTGSSVSGTGNFPGTIQEWYAMLYEVIYSLSLHIKKISRFTTFHLKMSRDVAVIIEANNLFKPSFFSECLDCGLSNIGELNGMFTIWKSRNITEPVIEFWNYDSNVLLGKIVILDMTVI